MGRQRRRFDGYSRVQEDMGAIYDRIVLMDDKPYRKEKRYRRRIALPCHSPDQEELKCDIRELLTDAGFHNISFCDPEGEMILVCASYYLPSSSSEEAAEESAA